MEESYALENNDDPPCQGDRPKASRELQINPGDDLVDVIKDKPDVAHEILTGEREILARARQQVADDFKKSTKSLRQYVKWFNTPPTEGEIPRWKHFGFSSEFNLTKDVLRSWDKAEHLAQLADRRHFNHRRRYIVDVTAAYIIQFLRENGRMGVAAMAKNLEEIRAEKPDAGIIIPKSGALRNFMRFLAEHDIPARLNAATWSSFHKKFGIRVPHIWDYSNQQWEIDSAESRVSMIGPDHLVIRPHLIAVVDCYSSLPMAAEIIDHYPTIEDTFMILQRAMLPKKSEFNWGGLPDALRYDVHGIFHNSEVAVALNRLGIETLPIPKGQSVNNGKVERSFRTFRAQFESQFPAWLRRNRRLHPDKEKYVGDLATFRREFHEWLWSLQMTQPREDVQRTRYDLWHSGLREGHDPFDEGLPARVKEGLRRQVAATIDGNCRIYHGGYYYKSPALKNLQGRNVTLFVETDTANPSIRVVCRGHDLGEITRTTEGANLANQINQANLKAIEDAFRGAKTLDSKVGDKGLLYPKHNKTRRNRGSDDEWDNLQLTVA